MRGAITTILVGQSTLLREGLARILIPPKFRVIASAPRIDALATADFARDDLRLLIIEAGASEIEHIALFKREHPLDRVGVLGNDWCPADIITAFRIGVNAYFARTTASEEFLKALELVMLGQTILPSDLLALVHTPEPQKEWTVISPPGNGSEQRLTTLHRNGPRLSARERHILGSIATGASNKMIAREIDISEATVKVHVKAILRKLGIANRTQAAIWAVQNQDKIARTFDGPLMNGAVRDGEARERR